MTLAYRPIVSANLSHSLHIEVADAAAAATLHCKSDAGWRLTSVWVSVDELVTQ